MHPALIRIAPVSCFLQEDWLYPGIRKQKRGKRRFLVGEKKLNVISQNFFELGCNNDPKIYFKHIKPPRLVVESTTCVGSNLLWRFCTSVAASWMMGASFGSNAKSFIL